MYSIQNDSELLLSIIQANSQINILEKKRSREAVDARMIYAKILREKGYTLPQIGKSISKDHSTIVHYVKTFDFLSNQLEDLRYNYDKCREEFLKRSTTLFPEQHNQSYIKEIIGIRNRKDELEFKEKMLTSLELKYNRLKNIIELIDNNTAKGEEHKIFCLMNAFFKDYVQVKG